MRPLRVRKFARRATPGYSEPPPAARLMMVAGWRGLRVAPSLSRRECLSRAFDYCSL